MLRPATLLAEGTRTLATWLEERIDLTAFRATVRHKVVPVHRHTIWYYFGGMTLFLFGVQVATGVLLRCTTVPAPRKPLRAFSSS